MAMVRRLTLVAAALVVPSMIVHGTADARPKVPRISKVVIARGERAIEESRQLKRPIRDYIRVYTIAREGGRKVVSGTIHLPEYAVGYIPRPDGKPIPDSTLGKKPGYYISTNGLLPRRGVCVFAPCDFGMIYVKFDYQTGALVDVS